MGKLSLELKKLTLKAKQLFYLLILGNKFIENKFVAFFHFYELNHSISPLLLEKLTIICYNLVTNEKWRKLWGFLMQ